MPLPPRCNVPGCSIFASISHDHVYASTEVERANEEKKRRAARRSTRIFQLYEFGLTTEEAKKKIAGLVQDGFFELVPGKKRTYRLTEAGEEKETPPADHS
jgi:hypothetical protein